MKNSDFVRVCSHLQLKLNLCQSRRYAEKTPWGLVTIAQLGRRSESVQLHVCCSHLTEEAPMVSILKVVGVLSCGFLLCLGLSYAVQAGDAASAMTADYTRTVPSSMSSP